MYWSDSVRLYASYQPTPARARDEYLWRKVGVWIQQQGEALERHRLTLAYYRKKKLLCRIANGELLVGPAWPDSWVVDTFTTWLHEQEKKSALPRHCF